MGPVRSCSTIDRRSVRTGPWRTVGPWEAPTSGKDGSKGGSKPKAGIMARPMHHEPHMPPTPAVAGASRQGITIGPGRGGKFLKDIRPFDRCRSRIE